jgi:hypothetical protein
MAMRFLERELRRELAALGREDLMDPAVGAIELTDDGETVTCTCSEGGLARTGARPRVCTGLGRLRPSRIGADVLLPLARRGGEAEHRREWR